MLDAALARARRSTATGPGSRICGGTSRYQLEDRIEQLFHEKSVTGRGAWNRLFDETLASLRFTVRGEELTLEPTLNKLQDTDGTRPARRRGGARRRSSGRTCASSR